MTKPKTRPGGGVFTSGGAITVLSPQYFESGTDVGVVGNWHGTPYPIAPAVAWYTYNSAASDTGGRQTTQTLSIQYEDHRINSFPMGIYIRAQGTDNASATAYSANGTGVYIEAFSRATNTNGAQLLAYHVDLYHEGVSYIGGSDWYHAYGSTPVGYPNTTGYNMEVKRNNTAGTVNGYVALNDPINSRIGGDGDYGFRVEGRQWDTMGASGEKSYALGHPTLSLATAAGNVIAGPNGSWKTQFVANAHGTLKAFASEQDALLGQFYGSPAVLADGTYDPSATNAGKILTMFAPLYPYWDLDHVAFAANAHLMAVTKEYQAAGASSTTTTTTTYQVIPIIQGLANGNLWIGPMPHLRLENDGFTYFSQALRTDGAFALNTPILNAFTPGSYTSGRNSPSRHVIMTGSSADDFVFGGNNNIYTVSDGRTFFGSHVGIGGRTSPTQRANLFVYGSIYCVDASGNLHQVYFNP